MRGKLDPAIVLYFPARVLNAPGGASCGKCMMYIGYPRGTGACTVVEGSIDGLHGICGLYVQGKHSGPEMRGTISKKVAGYVTNGPTHCGNCEYYNGDSKSGPCQIISDTVEFNGCCNAWKSAKQGHEGDDNGS